MDRYSKRIQILGRASTLCLSVLLSIFILTNLYVVVWQQLEKHALTALPFLNPLMWIVLPVLLSIVSILVVTMLDRTYFSIRHNIRAKFYILSWILFLGMIIQSFLNFVRLDVFLSLLGALSSVLIFRLYRYTGNTGGEESR